MTFWSEEGQHRSVELSRSFGLHAGRRAFDVFEAPLLDGLHDRPEGCAFFCETIGVSSWLLGRSEFFDQFSFDQSRESICQNVGRNALRGR